MAQHGQGRVRAWAGTIVLLAAVLACVRLGFWQLDRLRQRRALNAQIAARATLPPLHAGAALADTAATLYRRAGLVGQYDVERSIVLPGRSFEGVPGVHLLTPLRLDLDEAVLVNRGWVPAPDAATIPLDSFPASPPGLRVSVTGLVLPLPLQARRSGPGESGARGPRGDSGFRRVWYRLDFRALQAQFPYRLLPVEVQLLPAPGAPRFPVRLPPPALDEGPHLSYAIQWFSFAAIGVIGWLALVRRSRRERRRGVAASAGAGAVRGGGAGLLAVLLPGLLWPAPASGQLRPLDPPDWRIFDRDTDLLVGVGAGLLGDQPLTLAGSRGTLLELGSYRLLWRSGRIGLDLSGVAIWRLSEDTITGSPEPGVDPAPDAVRHDAGPFIAATMVRLSPERWSTDVMLRFGARIPTTSDESGLERDRTDWFALAGARWRRGGWSLAAETGVGINGARPAEYPQSDALLYAASVQRDGGPLSVFTGVTGQMDGLDGSVRGNEDKAELRTGIRLGHRWWLQTMWVRGLSRTSPGNGLLLLAGFATGCRSDCLPFN